MSNHADILGGCGGFEKSLEQTYMMPDVEVCAVQPCESLFWGFGA